MRVAPQFWRFTPALALLTAPLFVAFASLFSESIAAISGMDWDTFRFVLIGGVISAGIAFYQAARIDRIAAAAVIAGALCVNWCAFFVSGQYGDTLLYIDGVMIAIWLFALGAIFGTAYAHLNWLRWISLPVLVIATLVCIAWLGREVVVVYAPMIWDALTAPPLESIR